MENKKRLIDIEQAKRATYEEMFWTESEQAVVRNFLAKLPKVDAVEVIRCEECQHFKLGEDGIYYCRRDRHKPGVFMRKKDFCSYGKRREE